MIILRPNISAALLPFVPKKGRGRPYESGEHAFTFVELLAAIGAATLLCCLILPVLARAKQSPQAVQCLNNHRQLILAAIMYAEDNSGLWFPNQPSFRNAEKDWVIDAETFAAGNPNNYDIRVLTNPSTDFFARYINSPRIFHCPGDLSRVPEGPRIRSIAASQTVGTIWNGAELACPRRPGDPVTGQWLGGTLNDCSTTYRTYGKSSDMVAPPPSRLWVFIDEHADTISDAGFAVEVTAIGFGGTWIDVPASYHNGATGISFADGHVEMHKWVGTSLPNLPVGWTGQISVFPHVSTLGDVQDLTWMQQRTSVLAN